MVSEFEKHRQSPSLHSVTQIELGDCGSSSTVCQSRYQRWTRSFKTLETRGIEPVSPDDRQKPTTSDLFHMLLIWFSMGMAVNHMVVGSIGTLVMNLNFTDAALCAVFGNLIGGLAVGYMSTWGPRSGNRTLVWPFTISSLLFFSPFCILYGFIPFSWLDLSINLAHELIL